MKEIFLILAALSGAPTPAPTYRAPIGGETAAAMLDSIITAEGDTPATDPALDFNGDGALNIADFCGVRRRHYISTHEATAVTIDAETVEAIAAELYPEDVQNYFYYEFDHINGDLCREYTATAAEIMTARIYLEFEDRSTTIKAEINPYTESISIFKEA